MFSLLLLVINWTCKQKGKYLIKIYYFSYELNYQYRQVTTNEGELFCKENKLSFIEASAKTGENINSIFEIITSSLFESYQGNSSKEKDKTIVLDPEYKIPEEKKKKKCCKQ